MLLGFRAGADPAISVNADDFAGTRRAWGLSAGTAPLGRVFPAGANVSPSSSTPAQLCSRLDVAAEPVLTAGMIPVVSFKPDVAATLAGSMAPYFAAVGRWIAALGSPCYVTVWHEPENDPMGAPTGDYLDRARNFATVFAAAYQGVKQAAGDAARVGPVYMAYQWRPGSATTGTPQLAAAWRTSARDFVGLDSYTSNWSIATTGQTLALKSDVQRFLTASGTPPAALLLVERGITRSYAGVDDPDALQAVTLRADYDYLTAIGAHGLMVWNSGGANDDSEYRLGPAARTVFAACASDAAKAAGGTVG